jgi:chromosome segregation ATPase
VAINDLDGKVTKAADEMDRVAKELEAANAQLEKAVAAFRQAEQDANPEKQQLTADMEDLENQVNEAKLNLEDLKKKVAAARLAWATSKTVLLTQHAAASAGLTEKQADIHRIE